MSAYQTLYRAFRPRTFSDMVGQGAVVRALRNQVKSGKVAHAYLFCGSRGTGKTSAARIMAMAVNCESPHDGDPCLACAACKALASESTLDVYEMDAASNSRVEEIREMLAKTSYPPQFVRRKVYVIDEVHMLSGAAFNALLKTLEEPPEYMVFILATTEPQKLPATVLSRCQRYDFGRFSEGDIASRLRLALTGVAAEEGALQAIAAAAEGSMRDGWSLLDMCLAHGADLTEEAVREMLGIASAAFLFDFLDALGQGDAARTLSLCDELMRGGRDPQVFLRDLGAHIRQELSVHYTGKGVRDTTADALARYSSQAVRLGPDMLLHVLGLCMQSEADARWASSPRAVLELFALRVCAQAQPFAPAQPRPPIQTPPVPSQPPPIQAAPPPLARTEPDAASGQSATSESSPTAVIETMAAPRSAEPQDTNAQASPTASPAKTPKDAWNAMLKRLQTSHPGLYALVHRGRYGGFTDGEFRLAFAPEDKINGQLLAEEERATPIKALLSEQMGYPVGFAAGETPAGRRMATVPAQDENAEALIREFGRDKVILRKD